MKINKKIFIFCLILVIICVCSIFFIKSNYKKFGFGNNKIGNSSEEISNFILNINSYTAKAEITINSNKNTNRYVVSQEYTSPNTAKQVVIEPSNIEGLTIENNQNKLTVTNTKLNITKLYEDYNYITQNHLFLNTFIDDYKQTDNAKIEENEDEIILKANIKENNRYMVKEELVVDKKEKKPVKLKIEDVNQNVIVYIVYNEIELK